MIKQLENKEKQAIQKIIKIWMNANEESLSAILDRKIKIGCEKIIEMPKERLYKNEIIMGERLAFPMEISSPMKDTLYLIIKKSDVSIIIDLLIGGDGSSPMESFDDMHLIAFLQTMRQMSDSLAELLTENLNDNVKIKAQKPNSSLSAILSSQNFIALSSQLIIENVLGTDIEVLLPVEFCKNLYSLINPGGSVNMNTPKRSHREGAGGSPQIFRKAQFGSLIPENEKSALSNNLEMILDIPLEMTVVLGKTCISLRELLDLKSGSIFSLEKLAGEPVELFVNERFVGFGEVIVIDEHFGVRVIDVPETNNVSKFFPGAKRR